MTRPLKVLVAGNSASVMVTPPRRRRGEGTYGEVLVDLLADAGVDATVEHTGGWYWMVTDMRRHYEQGVRNRFPDVLVVNFGVVECQPRTVPTWLHRHLLTWNRSGHPVARAYRGLVAPPLWRVARRWARLTSRLPTYRLAPERYRYELHRLVAMAREETGALVLVLDIDPPGPRIEHWLPGIRQRWQRYQALTRAVVDSLEDDRVHLVPASLTVEELGAEVALPDGLHRSAAGHRRLAELLAAEVLAHAARPEAVRL